MWGSRSREETTVDVWIVGKWDWEDLNGTLSLQLQMAHVSEMYLISGFGWLCCYWFSWVLQMDD